MGFPKRKDGMALDDNAPANLDPIFILSPVPRCGTNFLWDLLRLHPHVAPGRPPIWEDYLLKNAGPLLDFADVAQSSWDVAWGPTDHLQPELLRHLGDALIRFMTTDGRRRMVTKSPTVANLDRFFDLFPDAYLLLLVRDGRDVAHSGMGTFGWTLEDAARWWAKEVKAIDSFARRADVPSGRYRIVRFEDLVEDRPAELERVLKVVDLPVESLDIDAATALPIRGSSVHRDEGGQVHWGPVPPTRDFHPVGRWRGWDAAARRTFNDIAGDQLELFGYTR